MVIGWRLASGFFDRMAQRMGSAKAPVFRVDVFAHALLLHHNAASLRTFLGFQANMLQYSRFAAYYRLRPQVPPAILTCAVGWVPMDLITGQELTEGPCRMLAGYV